MADTASLKEILFRHSAEQCKVCEAIPFDQIGHQIEYEKFKMLHEVVDTLCGLQSDTVLSVGQIKQLFDLAK